MPLIGGGLVIAFMAIPHVFVSHFAIGGGIFLAWTERVALRNGNSRLLEFVEKNTLFFVLITLVFGAATGVGIWFSIGLVHPPGTSILIHNFVFAWAIEWVFFVIEIAAALIYYYTWRRVLARNNRPDGADAVVRSDRIPWREVHRHRARCEPQLGRGRDIRGAARRWTGDCRLDAPRVDHPEGTGSTGGSVIADF